MSSVLGCEESAGPVCARRRAHGGRVLLIVALLGLPQPRSARAEGAPPGDTRAEGVALSGPRPAPEASPPPASRTTRMFSVRGVVGGLYLPDQRMPVVVLGGELAFSIRWPRFYWEILHAGWGNPLGFCVGTALGVPFRLDPAGRHELRAGVHLTSYTFSYLSFAASGLQLLYQLRLHRLVALQFALNQHSWPPGATMQVGVAFGWDASYQK